MMRQLVLGLLILALGGCSGSLSAGLPSPAVTGTPTAVPATRTPEQTAVTPVMTDTPVASSVPTTVSVTTFANATATIVLPTMTKTTAAPPGPSLNNSTGAILPTPMLTTGWKTYTNASWQVALDYPADWTVRESAAAVTFVSPNGALVQLTPVVTGSSAPPETNDDLPNTRCTSQTNSHGVMARVCFDTLAFSTIADFGVKPASGVEHWFSLVTNRRTGDLGVFAAMLASVRLGG